MGQREEGDLSEKGDEKGEEGGGKVEREKGGRRKGQRGKCVEMWVSSCVKYSVFLYNTCFHKSVECSTYSDNQSSSINYSSTSHCTPGFGNDAGQYFCHTMHS